MRRLAQLCSLLFLWIPLSYTEIQNVQRPSDLKNYKPFNIGCLRRQGSILIPTTSSFTAGRIFLVKRIANGVAEFYHFETETDANAIALTNKNSLLYWMYKD